jgi:hypothetical protein
MDRELSQALREAQEERSRLVSLTTQVGWKWYEEVLERHIESRRNLYELRPLEKMDEVLAEQYMKGELHGLRLAKLMIHARIEELEDDIQNLEQKLGL